MRISEIFYSLQGEGRLAGVPSTFVRLAGCPLRCRWCDTKYAWDEESGQEMDIEEIAKSVLDLAAKHVVITGGEPMVNGELADLVNRLKSEAGHITIETAGIGYIANMPCDLMSISPKLSNSVPDSAELAAAHEDSRLDIAVLAELMEHYDYQLKFVIDSGDDLQEIEELIEQVGNVDRDRVMLMPQATNRGELLAKLPAVARMCEQSGFALSQRLHVLLWGSQRGK
jgi:7-carboxy-7-deazaguanine synthase